VDKVHIIRIHVQGILMQDFMKVGTTEKSTTVK